MMSDIMETSLVVFVGLWAAMVAAMMLPSIVPLASRYARLFDSPHWPSWLSLGAGYLGVWSITGLAAFWLAGWLGGVAMANPLAAKVAAVTIYASAGLYQFTPLKTICLGQCRAPMSLLLQYASWRGVSRHFRVGAHHGLYCLGCCWLLMMLMSALGLMNFGAMLILAVVITVEKVWVRGEMFSYAVGAACLALAVAVMWFPQLAPGLLNSAALMGM